ncbi:hypothetical protein POX_a01365 [Penicillium oxalicum]|uniref:hypothetical protein n=1 Tax=Penicillium oxalicum TaxID=69781 RepID=UPI0020B76411|nr:hypothetical protein POX_a01365 [Penicillium oxalicum]KAI2794764.1 hypothetical protein POX_a01365 [Penicillium oxalicum]
MAHGSGRLPWDLIASNLEWRLGSSDACKCKRTRLHSRMRSTQSEDMTAFAKAFAKAIDEDAIRERAKYPQYEAPHPEDIIIAESLATRIEHEAVEWLVGDQRQPLRRRYAKEMRKASAFLILPGSNGCYDFDQVNGKGFTALEALKLLIIHNEMEPVLRVCAHKDIALFGWKDVRPCSCVMGSDSGWDKLYETVLRVYLVLNVAYCFPLTWDPMAGKTPENDYRHSSSYQIALRWSCTRPLMSPVMSNLFQKFYGISNHHFSGILGEIWVDDPERWRGKLEMTDDGEMERFPYGLLPFEDFITLEERFLPYMPNEVDCRKVGSMLCHFLPPELALQTMELADYKGERVLPIPHDPLHPLNKKVLVDQLDHLWQIMVCCQMVVKEIGSKTRNTRGYKPLAWEKEVPDTLEGFWGSRNCEDGEDDEDDEDEENSED